MSSTLLRQDVLPIGVGYLLVMGTLAIGLRRSRRAPRGTAGTAVGPGGPGGPGGLAGLRSAREGDPVTARRGGGGRPGLDGWPRLARHYAGTALGGYLLLMAVVILYYYGVARVGGPFIESAFTGCALLVALSAPVFALASWLAERRRSRVSQPPADPPRPGPDSGGSPGPGPGTRPDPGIVP